MQSKMDKAGLSRARAVTLLVALATFTSNTLSALVFAQLTDDPYHLARGFGWYLHGANVGSVFGVIGALRKHSLSIHIFSVYLLLDTILCSIPRFVLVSILHALSTSLCVSPTPPSDITAQIHQFTDESGAQAPVNIGIEESGRVGNSSPSRCYSALHLVQILLLAGVVAATMLQFVGALSVRAYARALSDVDEDLEVKEKAEEEENLVDVEVG